MNDVVINNEFVCTKHCKENKLNNVCFKLLNTTKPYPQVLTIGRNYTNLYKENNIVFIKSYEKVIIKILC